MKNANKDYDGMEENCSIASKITSDNEFTLEKRVKCIQKLYHKKTQLIQP